MKLKKAEDFKNGSRQWLDQKNRDIKRMYLEEVKKAKEKGEDINDQRVKQTIYEKLF